MFGGWYPIILHFCCGVKCETLFLPENSVIIVVMQPRLLRSLLCSVVLMLVAWPSSAQEGPGQTPAGGAVSAPTVKGFGPIAPNRPGFTNGSATVAPGDALAENGVALTRAAAAQGGAQTLDGPETNLRVGLTPTLEADAVLPDYFSVQDGPSGFGDGAIGVKYQFYHSANGNTKASVAPSLSLPTHTAFSSGQYDPALLLGFQTAAGARWSIASNLVVSGPTINGSRNVTTAVSSSVGYTLTSALSVYLDAYDIVPRTGPSSPVADGGLIDLINNNLQLDAELYLGLGGAAPVRALAGGVSFRL